MKIEKINELFARFAGQLLKMRWITLGLCRRHRLQHPHLFLFPWAHAHTWGAKESHHRDYEGDRLVGVLLWLHHAGVAAVVPGGVYPAMYWSVAILESASLP